MKKPLLFFFLFCSFILLAFRAFAEEPVPDTPAEDPVLTPQQVLEKSYEYESLNIIVKGKVDNLSRISIRRGGAPEIPFTIFEIKEEVKVEKKLKSGKKGKKAKPGSSSKEKEEPPETKKEEKSPGLKGAILGDFKAEPGTEILLSGTFYSSITLGEKFFENIIIEGMENCPYLKQFFVVETPAPPPEPAQEAPPMTPEQLLTSPLIYDRLTIRLIGEVENLELNAQLANLQVNKFNLTGKTRVKVQSFTSTSAVTLADGQNLLVAGIFHTSLKIEEEIFENILEVVALQELLPEAPLVADNTGKGKAVARAGTVSSPSPPPAPPKPKQILARGVEVVTTGKIAGLETVKVAGKDFPLVNVSLPTETKIKVVYLGGTKQFSKGSWVKVIGTYYSTYPTAKKLLYDVISAPRIEMISSLTDLKKVPMEGKFTLLKGKLMEKTEISFQGKKAEYLIIQNRQGYAFPIVSEEKQPFNIGANLTVSGRYKNYLENVTQMPVLKKTYTYPREWKKSLYPEFLILAFKLEKQ